METPRFSRALLDIPRLSFRAKALIFAATATVLPSALAIGLAFWPESFWHRAQLATLVASTLATSFICLLALRTLLVALSTITDGARAGAVLAGVGQQANPPADEVLRMMNDMNAISNRLESVRHRLANRHPVTGLPTREPLLQAIAKDMARGSAGAGLLGVIRLAQFDRLAAVDREGAEKVLRAFAQRLSHSLGGARPMAQVDRDAFAIWFCDGAGPKGSAEALKALADHLADPIGDGDLKTTPDVRIGAAIAPNDGEDPATLLACATAALTKSNRMSPGRLAFFSEESSVEAEARFSMEQALRQAIVRRELALFYQPVIDLTAGRVVGAEALLRWRHPELGSIPPAQFLPVLEQTGFIDEVGRWVLDTACRDAREFESLGLPGFKVGVNLSERQFRDPGLAPMVASALQRHGLKAQRLELELTESAMMEDLPRTREQFDALAAIGVNVAIDDFGAGASSLGDLKSLTFSKLKIDRAFVTDVASRHDGQAICAALIELGRRLDISVLAEGVETREEVEALRVLGCQLFQGFFFARPLPADKFMRKVADSDWLALISAPAPRQLNDLAEELLAG
ncbi:MAG TPA: EAL domain-containing protein [Caulobacteraceae bacterium]|nr:EAL domain-containing protein [Caulobacteraceae bacterium]